MEYSAHSLVSGARKAQISEQDRRSASPPLNAFQQKTLPHHRSQDGCGSLFSQGFLILVRKVFGREFKGSCLKDRLQGGSIGRVPDFVHLGIDGIHHRLGILFDLGRGARGKIQNERFRPASADETFEL